MSAETLLQLTADIVAAHVANNRVAADDLPALIRQTHDALAGLAAPEQVPAEPEHEPAVTARKSLANPDKIISMIDGKPYSSLKRHLGRHGLTPDQYRARYKLPASYPMIAPGYSEKRSQVARDLGLGRKRLEPDATKAMVDDRPAEQAPVADAPQTKRRGREPAEAAADAAPAPKVRKPRVPNAAPVDSETPSDEPAADVAAETSFSETDAQES